VTSKPAVGESKERLGKHDQQLTAGFEALRQLISPPPHVRRLGPLVRARPYAEKSAASEVGLGVGRRGSGQRVRRPRGQMRRSSRREAKVRA
jgi:hypothetical protein